MSKRRGRSWQRRACGVTLVEAVAGAAVLGTLLVSILVARSRLTVQARRARTRIQACQVLDELLQQWWLGRDEMPRNGTADVPDRPGWRWLARTIESDDAGTIGAQVVAVEVFGPAAGDSRPAARVEILLRSGKDDDGARDKDEEQANGRPDAG